VEVEWDEAKAISNLAKHGVDFADAVTALDDEQALRVSDPAGTEDRQVCVGLDGLGRLLTVVYTWRGEKLRVISARKATRREATGYLRRR